MLTAKAGSCCFKKGEWTWGRQKPERPLQGWSEMVSCFSLLLPVSGTAWLQGQLPPAPGTASWALGSQGLNSELSQPLPPWPAVAQLGPWAPFWAGEWMRCFHGNYPAPVETTQLPSPSHFWRLKQGSLGCCGNHAGYK